jgi:hypothetical protein
LKSSPGMNILQIGLHDTACTEACLGANFVTECPDAPVAPAFVSDNPSLYVTVPSRVRQDCMCRIEPAARARFNP